MTAMKLSIRRLRQIIAEEVISEAAVKIGLSDVEKEIIKNSFQAAIQRLVAEGIIKSDADLAAAIASCTDAAGMAADVLKMIPLPVWKAQSVQAAGVEGLAAASPTAPSPTTRNKLRRGV